MKLEKDNATSLRKRYFGRSIAIVAAIGNIANWSASAREEKFSKSIDSRTDFGSWNILRSISRFLLPHSQRIMSVPIFGKGISIKRLSQKTTKISLGSGPIKVLA